METKLILKMADIFYQMSFNSFGKKIDNKWEEEYHDKNILKNFKYHVEDLARKIRDDSVNHFDFPVEIDIENVKEDNVDGFRVIIRLPKELRLESRSKLEDLESRYLNIVDMIWNHIRAEDGTWGYFYRDNPIGVHDDTDYFGFYYRIDFFPKLLNTNIDEDDL